MSAVGLLDRPFTPPSDHRESRVTDWDDHMEVDHSGQEDAIATHDKQAGARARRSTSGAQSGDERRNVLSGLLAALATNSTDVKVTTSGNQDRQHRSVTPPQDSPISTTSPGASLALVPPEETPIVDATTTVTAAAAATATDVNDARLPDMQTANDISTIPAAPTDLLDLSTTTALDNIPIPAFEMPTEPIPHTPTSNSPINIKRQYDAFARLEFDDGIFYLNTYQCELGRDQHAYHIALQREREAQEAAEQAKHNSDSSRGRASQISNIIKAESQIQGSVVSEAGGFAGVDEEPVEGYGANKNGQPGRSQGSRSSDASIVRPADVLHNPSLHAPFDYNKEASLQFAPPAPPIEKPLDEDEQPAPITADHLPDPNSCPLIPIHVTSESETTELDGLKAISRRHMKIFWSWENSSFMLEILGRNGAFLEGEFVAPSEVVPLYTGANIQISSVNFVFRLPHIEEAASPSPESVSNIGEPLEPSPTNLSEGSESGQKGKLKLKLNVDSSGPQTGLTNGESRRRGPGRPPKDGVMSQRERKEREKADKEAKTRAINGDPSPSVPPEPQRKPSKTQLPKPEQLIDPTKPEKRKYNKRKREDGEEEQVLPSIEATDDTPMVEPTQNQPVAKKARTKSYSPPYKPKEECTQADLARPAHNYAVLLYQVLSQTGEISLRQIYKEMQSRWPYFKYIVESDGWTSSVRHNLNQEVGKLFLKGRKEGKGFTWLAKPNAMEEYQAQKNKRSNAPTAPRPRPPPPRANYPPGSGQQLTWQNNGPAAQPNGTGNALPHPGQWDPQQNDQNRPSQPPINGQPHPQGQMPNSHGPNSNAQAIEPPTPAHMIVTFLGVRIIDRFENTMMGQLRQRFTNDEEKLNKWSAVFRSARARCLNGAPASSLPEGETEDERTIMTHINNFVNMYKNPAFQGFHAGLQPVGINPQNPGVPVPNNMTTTNAIRSNSNSAPIAQAGANPSQNNSSATPSQQNVPSSTSSIPPIADSHSHPIPTRVPTSESLNAQPSVPQPAQVVSSTSNGSVPSTAPTATVSSPAVVTASATPPAPVPVAFKDTSPTANSATQPAPSSSGPEPVPSASTESNHTNSASSSAVPIPADAQTRPEPVSRGHVLGTPDASLGTGRNTAAATISQDPPSTTVSSNQTGPENPSPSSNPEPKSVAISADVAKDAPAADKA